jgi:predicted RNase H-like nuclease
MPVFIGVDLAWTDKYPSGVAVLEGDAVCAHLVKAGVATSISEVRRFARANERDVTFVGIDAPLVINNPVGQRNCERLVSQRYGSRGASCHSTNLTRFPNAPSVELARLLWEDGYVHAPDGVASLTMLEVYPHAAQVALFDLPQTIKYKKGRVPDRCVGLRQLQSCLGRLHSGPFPLRRSPALSDLLQAVPEALKGQLRKNLEDSLDAVLCAYVAYLYWYGRDKLCEVFGDSASGYIVNPRARSVTVGTSA